MGSGRHFVTGEFQSHATHVSDKEYGKMRDNMVRTCVDCLLVNKNREMLLGKRTRTPQPDWWIFGGGMRPGESFEAAAARNLKRELNLVIDPERFHQLNVYSFVWSRRAEPPQQNGCHDVSIVMVLIISDHEFASIQLNDEYEKVQWILPKATIADTDFHPAIRKCAKDLIASKRLKKLL